MLNCSKPAKKEMRGDKKGKTGAVLSEGLSLKAGEDHPLDTTGKRQEKGRERGAPRLHLRGRKGGRGNYIRSSVTSWGQH